MEPEQSVSSVYRSIIDDVVARVKPEFVGDGVDEAVLDELRVLWETKLAQTGALDAPPAAPQAPALPYGAPLLGYPQQQLGYPAAGAGPAPPRPASAYGQAYSQAHYAAGQAHRAAGQYQAHQYQGPPRPAAAAAAGHPHAAYNGALGQPAAQLGARAAPAAPAPAASGAPAPGALKRKLEDAEAWPAAAPAKHSTHTGAIPQQDGPADDDDEAGGSGAAAASAEAEAPEARDTLSDVESDEAEEDKEYDNVVVAQFEKVTRTKNRWKCTLKDGVMHLNGRDVLFHSAAGEMQF